MSEGEVANDYMNLVMELARSGLVKSGSIARSGDVFYTLFLTLPDGKVRKLTVEKFMEFGWKLNMDKVNLILVKKPDTFAVQLVFDRVGKKKSVKPDSGK
jgi:hypothetical protein